MQCIIHVCELVLMKANLMLSLKGLLDFLPFCVPFSVTLTVTDFDVFRECKWEQS